MRRFLVHFAKRAARLLLVRYKEVCEIRQGRRLPQAWRALLPKHGTSTTCLPVRRRIFATRRGS